MLARTIHNGACKHGTLQAHCKMNTDQPKSKLAAGIAVRVQRAGYLLAAITLFSLLAQRLWIADILCNFRVQYVLLFAAAIACLLLLRRWKTVFVFAVFLAINAAFIWNYLPTTIPVRTDKSLRIMCANVLSSNLNYEAMAKTIAEGDPHVVAIIEVSPAIAEYFETNATKYPYRHFLARKGNFGIGIMSRVPLTKVETLLSDPLNLPSYRISLESDGKTYQLIATHPIPPIGSVKTINRDSQLLQMAGSFTQEDNRILMGDFNMTPWSPRFHEVLSKGNLVDSGAGFGLTPTWTVFPTLLGGIRIDHILVSPSIKTNNHRVLEIPGSDHCAVVIDIGVD